MTREIEELLQRHKRLKDERRVWESHWQDLAEVMLPRRADFTTERIAGERRSEHLFDGTPMLARRGLAGAPRPAWLSAEDQGLPLPELCPPTHSGHCTTASPLAPTANAARSRL